MKWLLTIALSLLCLPLGAQNIINPYRFGGTGAVTGGTRITEEGDTRKTEEGDTRITDELAIILRLTETGDFRITEEGDDRKIE